MASRVTKHRSASNSTSENHIELPLLEQFDGLGWDTIDLINRKQLPADSGRENSP